MKSWNTLQKDFKVPGSYAENFVSAQFLFLRNLKHTLLFSTCIKVFYIEITTILSINHDYNQTGTNVNIFSINLNGSQRM